jgi:hypothetical protein
MPLSLDQPTAIVLFAIRSLRSFGPAPRFAIVTEHGFVHLNSRAATANGTVVLEHRANLLDHAPRGFVNDARLTLDLFQIPQRV